MISPDFLISAKKYINPNSFLYSINVRRIELQDVSDNFNDMLLKSSPWNDSKGRYSLIHNANGGIQIYPKDWIAGIGGADESLIYWGGMDNDVFERAIMSKMATVNINIPILHQEHKLKKEKQLSGADRINAIFAKIPKAEYLNKMLKEGKYIRNDMKWGLQKPNQERFLKSTMFIKREIKRKKNKKKNIRWHL